MLELYRRVTDRSRDVIRQLLHDEILRRGAELEDIARAIEGLAGGQPGTLLREATDIIRRHGVLISETAELALRPFLLFVVGMGNYGKSTLVNALVGARVADMDCLPKTWKIDIFSANQPPDKVRIRLITGQELWKSVHEARRYLQEEERRREESEEEIERVFAENSADLKTVEEKEELRDLLRRELLYRSPVSEVHWPCPPSPLLRRFDIVDTPGLIQTLHERTVNDLREYYHKADGVLWMLDAVAVSAKNARQLIDDLNTSLESVGGYSDNIIAVLNRIDLVHDGAGGRRVLDEARRIYGDRFLDIIPLSASQALKAAESGDEQGMESSGLTALTRAIDHHFLSKAVTVRFDARIRGVYSYARDAEAETKPIIARLQNDDQERRKRIRELDLALAELEALIRDAVSRTLEQYRSECRQRILVHAEGLFYARTDEERTKHLTGQIFQVAELEERCRFLQQHIEGLISETLMEQLKRAVFHETRYLRPEAVPAIHRSQKVATPVVASAQLATDGTQFGIGLAVAGLAALLVGPLGLLLLPLAGTGLVKWVAVQFKLGGLQRDLCTHLDSTVDRVAAELSAQIDSALGDVAQQVTQVREESFAALYCGADQVPNVLGQFARMREVGSRAFPRPQVARIIAGTGRRVGLAADKGPDMRNLPDLVRVQQGG